MNTNLQQRTETAQNRRYTGIAKMEDAHRRMEIATRGGDGPDPADLATFEAARAEVGAVDVELRELSEQARAALGGDARMQIDTSAASGMAGLGDMSPFSTMQEHARTFGQTGRVDAAPLFRALAASPNQTTGKIVCKTLLQGVAVGQLGRTRQDGSLVAMGNYGATPLVGSVEVIPVSAGIFYWQRVEPNAPPALGPKTAEGALKTQVILKSTPVSTILETFAAFEKVSLQSLQDQAGLVGTVERLLQSAVLRSADADAWTAFLAGSTAIVADATDGIATIIRTAAKVADKGGTGIRAILNPTDYANMFLAKAAANGSWLGLPPGIELPTLVQSSGIPAGKLLVTAGTDGAFVAVRQSIEALIGMSGDDFVMNLRTVLVEGRMAPGVRNPELSYAGNLAGV